MQPLRDRVRLELQEVLNPAPLIADSRSCGRMSEAAATWSDAGGILEMQSPLETQPRGFRQAPMQIMSQQVCANRCQVTLDFGQKPKA